MVTCPDCGHFFSDRRHASCLKCPPPNKATNQPSQEIASPPPQQTTSPPPQQMANQPSTTPGAPFIPLVGVNLRDIDAPKGAKGLKQSAGNGCLLAFFLFAFGLVMLLIPFIGWLVAIVCFVVGFGALTQGTFGGLKYTYGTFDALIVETLCDSHS